MIHNYIIAAFRNFTRHLGYSIINLSGLTVGLATCIFIFLWVYDEVSYETHYPDHERIYQVIVNDKQPSGNIESSLSSHGPLAKVLQEEFPEVAVAARSDRGERKLIRHEDKSMIQNGYWADSEILDVFSMKVIAGDREKVLDDNHSIAITASVAREFFGNENPIGKVFKVQEKYDMRVTAVIEDPQPGTRFDFDFLLPYEVYFTENDWMKDWNNTSDLTYVKLREDVSIDQFNSKIENFIKTKCKDCSTSIWLQRFDELRLYSRYENGKAAGGKIEYIRLFVLIGIFVLALACINFMNLATARSATRSKEIGVRKVSGAQRGALIVQFMSEALMLSLVSIVIAIGLVQLLLPMFNQITEKQVTLDFGNPTLIFALGAFALVTGLAAGSYPAFYLSSFKPALVLKNSMGSGLTGLTLRKALVIFQFTITIVLTISAIVIYRQVGHIKTKNLGFDRENVLTFEMRDGISKNAEAFKAEALRHPGIKNVSFAGENPFALSWRTRNVSWPTKSPDANTPFKIIGTDKDFISTLNMELIAGTGFTNPVKDSASFIVNETALKLMGYQDPIGAPINLWNRSMGKIIGVVKDFHTSGFKHDIEPLIITHFPGSAYRGFVKMEGSNIEAAIQHLETVQKKFEPYYPFEYGFLDQQFESEYKMESTIEDISMYFTGVALLISCLGLFGLASFTAEKRTKELGVRKVLGASEGNLVALLCKDFSALVMISIVIGCPIAYYLMDMFLSGYTEHTSLSYTIFLLSSIGILTIAMLTVGFKSLKAAMQNPIKGLRSE